MVHKSPPLDLLSQIKPNHTIIPYFSNTYYIIISHLCLGLPNNLSPLASKSSVCISTLLTDTDKETDTQQEKIKVPLCTKCTAGLWGRLGLNGLLPLLAILPMAKNHHFSFNRRLGGSQHSTFLAKEQIPLSEIKVHLFRHPAQSLFTVPSQLPRYHTQ